MTEFMELFNTVGVSTACLVYFMWSNTTQLNTFTSQMAIMNENTKEVLLRLEEIEKQMLEREV